MRRREFITLLGGAAVMWPLVARGQQTVPVIGFLNATSPKDYEPYVIAFRQGLRDLGYIDGSNVVIDYKFAVYDFDRLPSLVAALVKRPVSVIFSGGGSVTALA